MVDTLSFLFKDAPLISTEEFTQTIQTLASTSVFVYFKSAQLCKVYNSNEIESMLEGQLRTAYKNIKDAYEIIPIDSKQKIMIMCDISARENITRLKSHIIEFMTNVKKFKKFGDDDIVCYDTGNMIHILLTNYYVNNANERDMTVKELVKFIKNKGNDEELSRKIMPYIEPPSDFEDTDMVVIPCKKKQFMGKQVNYIDGLLKLVDKNCNHISSGKTVIVVGDVHINNSTNIDNSVTNINQPKLNENIEDFIEHVKNDNPSWFKFNEWIDKKIMTSKYKDRYKELPKDFYALTRDRLWSKTARHKTGFGSYNIFTVNEIN